MPDKIVRRIRSAAGARPFHDIRVMIAKQVARPPVRFQSPGPRVWLLVVVAACLLLPDLGRSVARRAQEMRVLLTARDMCQTGRWLDPHFKGEPRLRKPPLMYWLVGGLYRLGVPMDSTAGSRLPSALAGMAYVAVLYALGRRLVGRRRAFAAALVAAMSVIVLRQARLASTDMCLALFTTVAVLAGALALRGVSPRWWLPCFLSMGLGFLTKGPAALVLPPAAWFAYAGWRRWRVASPLRQPAFWWGLALCLALALPWYLLLLWRQHAATDAQVEAELSALLVTSKHTGPFYYYVYTTLHALAPWSLLLPAAVWAAMRFGRRRAAWSLPLAWLLSSFLVLSALSSKQFHYALLLAAPGSLLIGCALPSRVPRLRRWSGAVQVFVLALLSIGGVGLLLALAARGRSAPVLPAALSCAAIALGILALRRPGVEARLVAAGLALAALQPAARQIFADETAHGAAVRRIASLATRSLPAGVTVFCVGPLDATCAFYANRPSIFARSLAEAWRRAAPGDLILATWRPAHVLNAAGFPTPPVALEEDPEAGAAAFIKSAR